MANETTGAGGSTGWLMQVYVPIASLSALVAFVFGVLPADVPGTESRASRIGWLHMAAILAVGVGLPLVLGGAGGALVKVAGLVDCWGNWLDRHRRLIALSLGGGALATYTVVGWLSSGWQPVLHDEFSYLFGAQTFAAGRLFNAPHAHAEFFDAMHVLHEDKWVTRYPPGHSLALLPGVVLGWPGLGPVVLCAGAVLCTYQLAKDRLGPAGAAVAGLLALQAPALVLVSSGLMAQSTFWVLLTGFYVCLFRSGQGAGTGWAVGSGLLGGLMLLTRPFPAVAMGWPGAVWLLWRTGKRMRRPVDHSARTPLAILLGSMLPFAGLVAVFLADNFAITGSLLYTPWQQYRDRYEPANGLGFSRGAAEPRTDPRTVHWRKHLKAEAMRADKQRFTPGEALRRAIGIRIESGRAQHRQSTPAESLRRWLLFGIDPGRWTFDPKRVLDTLFPPTCFLGLVALWAFAWRGRTWSGPDWVLLTAVMSHYVFYSFFHAARDVGYYAAEPAPLLVYFTAAGAVGFWRHCRGVGRPTVGLTAAALIVTALLNHLFVQGPAFVMDRRQATACQRDFGEKLASRPHAGEPAIVFVRYRRDHPFDQCDWINNCPTLDAPVLVVLDLGERNAELMRYYPQRRGFVFDEAANRLVELPPAGPA